MSLTIAGWFSNWAEKKAQQVLVLRRRPAILMAPPFRRIRKKAAILFLPIGKVSGNESREGLEFLNSEAWY
jgi:hypothetical protein